MQALFFSLSYSEMSMSQLMMSEGTEAGKSGYPSLGLGNTFAFKFVDLKGRVHRFNFGECCRLYYIVH